MRHPANHHPKLRSYGRELARPIVLAISLALGACGDPPLAPTGADDALTGATESAEPEAVVAALTAPRIAFTSYRNNQHPDIYLMDPQGKNVTRLTSWAGDEVGAAWSYNNKRIAMVRPRLDATNTRHDDIYLMNVDGTGKRWARSSPSWFPIASPSWSPDGTRLVVTVAVQGTSYLATMTLATGEMAFVTLGGKPLRGHSPSFDPTGARILYIGPTGRTIEAIHLSSDTGYLLLTSPTPIGRPTYSPNGTRIAYSQTVGNNNMEIFLLEGTNGGGVKRLTYSAGTDTEPTWSPDGTRIAFASRRTGQYQIYVMSATGGAATRITHTVTGELSPSWSH